MILNERHDWEASRRARVRAVLAVLVALALTLFILLFAMGCVSPGAVDAPADVHDNNVVTQVPVLSPHGSDETATSRPAVATQGDISGTSNKVANAALTLAGSGWPLVVAIGFASVAFAYYMKNRANKAAIVAVGQSVADMGDSPQRKDLLKDIGVNAAEAGVKEHLTSVLAAKDLLVK